MFGLMVPLLFASLASGQAGVACGGGGLAPTQCGLGGQIRGQIGDGLPLPISIARPYGASGSLPGLRGPFTAITIQTAIPESHGGRPVGRLPFVGQGLGQTGQIKPTPSATVMQTTGPAPRALTLAPGAFRYGNQPQGSIAVVNFNISVIAVQTNLEYDTPHPGTTKSGAAALTFSGGAIPTPSANVLSMGGRKGNATVTYYANATTLGPGSPSNNFGSPSPAPTPAAGEAGADNINGVARFTATGNQFGGQVIGRAMGTARVYFNSSPLVPASDLPCKVTATPLEGTTAQGPLVPFNTGADCQFGLSIVDLTLSTATVGVAGGAFGGFTSRAAFTTTKGVFTGTIGFNGTLIGQNNPVTASGVNVPFTGHGHLLNVPFKGEGSRAVGFPLTTGRLSITVTDVVGTTSERFVRTGIDARDANGNGVVALVTGSMTARDISGGNANRTYFTLEIPEPSAIFSASAGLLALFGCHRIVRRP